VKEGGHNFSCRPLGCLAEALCDENEQACGLERSFNNLIVLSRNSAVINDRYL
jgi:hypothetical protein